MKELKTSVDNDVHRKLAAELFNLTWDLIEKPGRSEIDNETMVNAAHASRYHWGIVGTPLHFARGEWQISRVYALLGRSEPALFHGRKSMNLCLDHHLGDFDLGFAHEAMARAYVVQGDITRRDEHVALAKQSAEKVSQDDDRTWLMKNVQGIESLSLAQWEDKLK